jgi:uncharacterized protein YbaA (DUF1428 family)
MSYIDGYLIPMPKSKVGVYRKIASAAGKIWMKHGALAYVEAVGDQLDIPGVASFKKTARAKPGETVVFSYIVYKSRAHRDRVNAAVMKDPKLMPPNTPMPFDLKRMNFGGFKPLVDLKKRR